MLDYLIGKRVLGTTIRGGKQVIGRVVAGYARRWRGRGRIFRFDTELVLVVQTEGSNDLAELRTRSIKVLSGEDLPMR